MTAVVVPRAHSASSVLCVGHDRRRPHTLLVRVSESEWRDASCGCLDSTDHDAPPTPGIGLRSGTLPSAEGKGCWVNKIGYNGCAKSRFPSPERYSHYQRGFFPALLLAHPTSIELRFFLPA